MLGVKWRGAGFGPPSGDERTAAVAMSTRSSSVGSFIAAQYCCTGWFNKGGTGHQLVAISEVALRGGPRRCVIAGSSQQGGAGRVAPPMSHSLAKSR